MPSLNGLVILIAYVGSCFTAHVALDNLPPLSALQPGGAYDCTDAPLHLLSPFETLCAILPDIQFIQVFRYAFQPWNTAQNAEMTAALLLPMPILTLQVHQHINHTLRNRIRQERICYPPTKLIGLSNFML